MAHQRQVIRHAVRDLLVDTTAAGANVTATRMLPYRKQDLPCISVYTLAETVTADSETTAPRELTRELTLEIAGWVGQGAGMDDAMDALALEIETAMDVDRYLGGEAGESILKSTEMSVRGEGDALMGLVTLTYSVTYRTMAPEANDDLAEFLTADARHRIPAITDPTQDGHDTFTVRETP